MSNIEKMIDTFTLGFQQKIHHAQKNLIEKIDKILPKLDFLMLQHLNDGYFGFEILRDPFLWREECIDTIREIDRKIKEKGYKFVMNSLYHTVMIIPPIEVCEKIKANFSVGMDDSKQLIHYTIEEKNIEINKEWKSDKDTWCRKFQTKLKN